MTVGPQLSSLRTSLSELSAQLSAMAESFSGTERDDLAIALFEVERSLHTAGRRLDRIVDSLR